MDAFGHTVTLSGLEVTGSGGGGGSEYIVAQLTTTLQNPSNISLNTIDVSLPVYYEGVTIGRAAISVRLFTIFQIFNLKQPFRILD